jgi:hypothetical protein
MPICFLDAFATGHKCKTRYTGHFSDDGNIDQLLCPKRATRGATESAAGRLHLIDPKASVESLEKQLADR